MRKLSLVLLLIPLLLNATTLFYYSPKNGSGLRFAVQRPDGEWKEIGKNFNFATSDFGSWGTGKKMFNPLLLQNEKGWKLIFDVSRKGNVYGVSESENLIAWHPQNYFNSKDMTDLIEKKDTGNLIVKKIGGNEYKGRIIEVENEVVERLQSYYKKKQEQKKLYSERSDSDFYRFKELDDLKGSLKISSNNKDISPLLLGIFFEDINYSADGGLYAELIQNRDFEYKKGEGRDKNWDSDYAWKTLGSAVDISIQTENPIHPNNPHYARLSLSETPKDNFSGLYNTGYDGISLKKGEKYNLKFKARSNEPMPLEATLISGGGKPITSVEMMLKPGKEWEDYETTLIADDDYKGAFLKLLPGIPGTIDIDLVSLFPETTYKGRENGLRADLAQTLADLKPKFVRFPGGCVAHGNGIDNIYDWKGSIGTLETRKPLSNLWGYHQTRGLGYYEYFQFCEDIGALPLPVLAAGVPCQNSSRPSSFTVDDLTLYGQQQGLPMDSINSYIQDILDLIEYANGSPESTWGKKRAEAGHPEPFNLQYIGIGNEDMITDVFKERFAIINQVVKEAHPEITVIGTVGPFYEGPDYTEGWEFARHENVDMVDEHYYVDPAWLIYNQDFYDDYDREGPKVYLGEWAAHLPNRDSTMETALTEALYITSLEKNGDVVTMSSYAPLLAKLNHTQWRPDLIYFDNDSVYPTTDYHAFRLAGENSGDKYYYSDLTLNSDDEKVLARVGASVVKDSETGDYVLKFVNILPVEIELNIDCEELTDKENLYGTKPITVMQGSAQTKNPNIINNNLTITDSNFDLTLQPYSFTIIRL